MNDGTLEPIPITV